MKITIYTITDCQFSKQEKEYLTANKLAFEEKNLETNKEFLSEMLTISNNFAGTPVTKIDKDDGQIAILKGFTKEEFDKALGLSVEPAKPVEVPAVKADGSVPPPETVQPPAAQTPTPVTQPPVEPQKPLADETPVKPVDPMASVLNTLQTQAEAAPPIQAPVAPPMPSIPDPKL
ncbi:hypothetical protein COY90_04945 [Candidatus Roizmanbacteria bacterium CG_4_10_14_0_8_um_filter_39_9]|uniref:Glutaredoxin domain-containing protein n=1 Tax=Candidatus Roizmanbacteria bacterium CG_4_10_14_0_8_um_filter_39_9 TaxID=1974829 RepID=A0A2M7QBL9_9BACT|nr:MAG: hypothetical protein COY90_04945 [Candidatus Roizmanbacteria bacterium CG_4_10_14_0_8_um_filter_39_9]